MIHFDSIATYARSNPKREAIVDLESDRRWTYAELDRAIDRLAAWLVDELGPNSGARVATLSRNCVEMVILQLAGVRAGTIFVPLNWRLAPAEIDALTADTSPELFFYEDAFEPPAEAIRVLPIAGMSELGDAGNHPSHDARRPFDAVSTLLFTSGTSGKPKAAMLSEF